jgi:dTMP kinase
VNHYSNSVKRGLFIVFCGLDGSGKSTLLDNVVRWMFNENIDHECGKHPPDEWIQNPLIVEKYILEKSDNISDIDEVKYTYNLRKKYQEGILSALINGKYVLYHRYIFSLITYYYAKKSITIKNINNIIGDLLKPDIVFYLKISTKEFYDRAKIHGLLEFQNNRMKIDDMISCYDYLAQKHGWIIMDSEKESCIKLTNRCISIITNYNVPKNLYDLNGNKIEFFR